MIQCQTCKATFYPGTLFCKECGRALLESINRELPEGSPPKEALHYLLPGSGRQGVLHISEPVWVGRADPEQSYWPELDLTEDDGLSLGVSRWHALIQQGANGPVLIDQGSANGTWVDQERLIPQTPWSFPNAAIVRFGRLLVHFFVE